MTTPHHVEGNLRRAVVLMTVSSFVVPAAGIVTQPVLAQALGVAGRGQLAVAVAPAALALAVATLGLPDALTYFLARTPSISRRAISLASGITLVLGLICLLATYLTLPILSTGDPYLEQLILLSMAITVPALLVGVLRGAATGRQMWRAVALEKIINAGLRIVVLGVLWLCGVLTLFTAVLVTVLGPLVSGFAFWQLARRTTEADVAVLPENTRVPTLLLSYGTRVWLGSIASMLLARIGQVIMAPLSTVEDVGLYSVATTVADMPIIVALAVAGALTGVNSRTNDAGQITKTSRVTLLVGLIGCGALAATTPFWLPALFGADFRAAIVPTIMLLGSAALCIPGMMASAGLGAWGRPGIRSVGLAATLVVNLTVFIATVPSFGVFGACWASIAGNVVMSSFMVITSSRVIGVRWSEFVVIRGDDVRLLVREAVRIIRRLAPGKSSAAGRS